MKRAKGYPWRLAWFSMAYYAANAVQQGYISKYYQSMGIWGNRLTVLLAVTPLVSLAAQPLWGMAGDRARSRNRVLRIMIGLAMGAAGVLGLNDRWSYLLLVSGMLAAVFPSIQPMGDSIVLEALERDGHSFGPIRLTGCVAFAIVNVVFGLALAGERIRMLPWLGCGALGVTLASTWALPETAGHQSERSEHPKMSAFLQNREMLALLGILMVLQMTMGYFYSFFPVYYTEMPGGSTAWLGVCYFIGSLSEIPFLLLSRKLYERLGAGRLMMAAAVCMGTRWLILFLAGNGWLVMASQVLHGGGFIVITVTMAMYMAEAVPREWQAMGQMLVAMAGFGVARTFGILGGGLIAQALGGIRAGFGLMAAVTLAALPGFAALKWGKNGKRRAGTP